MGTTGRLWEIRIFNHKAASSRRIDKVDFRAVKMRIEFLLRCQHDIAEVIFRIDSSIEYGIEIQGVLHSTTSATENTDPQERIASKALRHLNLPYLVYCCWSY